MSSTLKVVGASWMQTKISSYILGILGILAILALFIGLMDRIQEDGNYAATVFYSEKTGYRIAFWGQSNELAEIPAGAARAYFRMDIETTGWSLLEVETSPSYPDDIQAYAAGVVEGALTWSIINMHLENTITDKCKDPQLNKQCNKLRDAFDKSVSTWTKYAEEHESKDPYWHQVSLYYTQLKGIYTGWNHGIARSNEEYETDLSDLYWLNSVAEVPELQRMLNISIINSTVDNLPDLSTAFLRIVNETTDDGVVKKIYMAQNTAGRYSSMTRILKRYKLNYHRTSKSQDLVLGTTVEFSGYPGSITSQDEYYIVNGHNQRMVVTGTPLRNYNSDLWKLVNITEQVPVGPRLSAANRLANNVSSWAHIMASSNSGTASKKWLVVDLVRFQHLSLDKQETKHLKNEIVTERSIKNNVRHTVVHRGAPSAHAKGLASIVEQVPGLTYSADLSDALLDQGYWASYGLPFFAKVAATTHINQMAVKYGRVFSEADSPRAILFKRGYKNATSLEGIIKLMRENNVTAMNRANNGSDNCGNDNNIECAISDLGYWSVMGVRGDLVTSQKEAYGVIDTKIVSATQNSPSIEFVAIGGPPYTPVPSNETVLLNKGNAAPIYTEEFNNKPDINGLEIRNLVKQQQEEAEQETLELFYRDVIKPFQWSDSVFRNETHTGLPDKWEFGSFKPNWSW